MDTDKRTDVRAQAELTGAVRAVGLPAEPPSMASIEHRRTELLVLTFIVLFGFSLGIVLLTFTEAQDLVLSRRWSVDLLRVGVVGLAAVFALYVLDVDRRLARVMGSLVDQLTNERAVSAALENRLQETEMLSEAGRAVAAPLGLEHKLKVILEAAAAVLGSDDASVMLLHDDHLVLAAGVGRSEGYLGHRQGAGDGVAGYVARLREPLLLEGELEMAEFYSSIGNPVTRDTWVASSVSVPITIEGVALGVMNFNVTDAERRYAEYDVRTAELFAQNAALAIHHDGPRHRGRDQRSRGTQPEMGSQLPPRPAIGDTACESPSTGSTTSVLVVDDDPSVLRMLRTAFEVTGARVTLASDGLTALRRIDQVRPDVVLLDIMLPEVDGWGVLEQLRSRATPPKVICMTGKTNRRDQVRAWTMGADGYVTKPFDIDDLLHLTTEVAQRAPHERTDERRRALQDLYVGG